MPEHTTAYSAGSSSTAVGNTVSPSDYLVSARKSLQLRGVNCYPGFRSRGSLAASFDQTFPGDPSLPSPTKYYPFRDSQISKSRVCPSRRSVPGNRMNGVKGSQPKARWLASLVTGAGKDLCKETKRLSISRSPPLPIGYERRKQDVPQVKPSYVTGTEFRKFSPYATLRQTCAKAENTQTPVVVSVVEVFEMDDVDVGDGSSEIGESQPCLFPRGYIPSPLNPWKHVFPHCTPDGSRSPRKNSIVKRSSLVTMILNGCNKGPRIYVCRRGFKHGAELTFQRHQSRVHRKLSLVGHGCPEAECPLLAEATYLAFMSTAMKRTTVIQLG
ncbi:hypothetical protein BKA93DRAFT_751158 [Sparassis latifolia]